MKKYLSSFLLLTFVFLLNPIKAEPQSSIVIVASYSKNDLCGRPQYQGILQAIKESKFRIYPIKTIFLDSKRRTNPAVQKKIKKAISIIKKQHPRIVITIDDLAFAKVGSKFIGSKDIYVVFTGINRPLTYYNEKLSFLNGRIPTKNITGVYEKLFIKEQMDFLQMLVKRQPLVAIIYSTDFMGNILKNQIVGELTDTEFAQKIRLFPVLDTGQLAKAIKEINSNPDIAAYIPITLSIVDQKDERRKLTVKDLAPLLTKRIKKIDLAINKAFTRAGFFGGVSVDFLHMGYQAGRLAVLLMDGFPISNLNVENASLYKIVINKKRLKQLNIKLDDQILNMVDEFI